MRYGFISAISEKNHLAVSEDRNSTQLTLSNSKQHPYPNVSVKVRKSENDKSR